LGQKVNPVGLRLGITRTWDSNWFDERNFAEKLKEDLTLRKYIEARLDHAGISKIGIDRTAKKITLTIFTARPGIVIGRKGSEVDKLKVELQRITNKDVQLNIEEVKRPELDAYLVAKNVAKQLESKIGFRRAMKKSIMTSMRMGAEGVKIAVAGRLGGAEMARTEQYKDGRIPLHTLRANIDYAATVAKTTYGIIGVKVWICLGEKFSTN
jgi:small subunit ribosomal protein S3